MRGLIGLAVLLLASCAVDEGAPDPSASDVDQGVGGSAGNGGAKPSTGGTVSPGGGAGAKGGAGPSGGAGGADGGKSGGGSGGVSPGTGGSSSGGSNSGGSKPDSGPFVPPTCTQGSTALPPGAPVLVPGTWKNISPAGVPFGAVATSFTQGMTMDPCNPATLYVCVHGQQGGVWRTVDAGSSWTAIGDFGACLNVRVDPGDPKHLYMGSGVRGGNDGFWVSTDGGQTWAIPEGYKTAAQTCGYDVYHVEPDPADFNHVLVSFHYKWQGSYGENAGVAESKDGGQSWTLHPPLGSWGYGGGIYFLYDPAHGVGDDRTWLFGSQGNGYWRTTDSGGAWTQVTSINMDHGGAQLYRTKSGVLYVTGNPRIQKSSDNGVTWTPIGPGGAYLGIYGDGSLLYTGVHGGGPFIKALESADGTWTNYNAQTFYEGPFEMVFDSANRILYSANIRAGVWALKVVDP